MGADSKRLEIFTVTKREGQEKGFWVRIGTAWENKDGSLNCVLDALPVNGTMNIREPREREDGDRGHSNNQGGGRRSGGSNF